jgi:hypothetical protein
MFEPPLEVNPYPEAKTVEMLRFELPVFVSVIGCVVDVPTCTSPKLRLELLAESSAAAVGGVALAPEDAVDGLPADCLVDPQPIVPSIAINANAKIRLLRAELDVRFGI